MSIAADLARIEEALAAAALALEPFTPGEIESRLKAGDDPVTAADLAVDARLRSLLPRAAEGWLSEETADDPSRLRASRVWVVDPIDGTREFIQGIPEWCVSIGLVEEGRAVAGGILNPATGERILGALGGGVDYRGTRSCSESTSLTGATVLASRSEVGRGEWDHLGDPPFRVVAMGSVAFKLALVAAERVDATWTLVAKNEWDVAAGAALVAASGGLLRRPDAASVRFNRATTLLPGFVAARSAVADEVVAFLGLPPLGAEPGVESDAG